jgi:hypothetical protein
MKSDMSLAWLAAGLGFTMSAWANTAPTVIIESAAMRAGTTYMDVVYRVEDPDDATVKVRALAFVDGVRSFAKVIRPATFVEGTETNLGDSITTNAAHTLTWNVGADWNVSLGQIKFEVLAVDARGLLPFEWLTIPAAGGKPALTVSQNAPTSEEVLDALFWRYAADDPGLRLETGRLIGTAVSGAFSGVALAVNDAPQTYAPVYLFKAMNLMPADAATEIAYADSAARTTSAPDMWHAKNIAYTGAKLLIGWGNDTYGQLSGVVGRTDIVKIAPSTNHVLALGSQGTVSAWGHSGFATVPEGLNNVAEIAASPGHNLALKTDGTVVAWGGNNIYGQLNVPPGLGPVKAIAAGGDTSGSFGGFSVAVTTDGNVVAWGNNLRGQTNVPVGLSDVVAVAAGSAHTLALKADGTVVAWGYASLSNSFTPPAGLTDVVAIAIGRAGTISGSFHNLALKSDGTVVAWGSNTGGQLDVPEGLTDVVAIAAGALQSLALKADGTVVAWGTGAASMPQGLAGVSAIAAGPAGGYVLKLDTP